MHVAHRRLNVIVPGDVQQSKWIGVLSSFGEKRVPQRVQSGVWMRRDFRAHSLNLYFECSESELTSRMVGTSKDVGFENGTNKLDYFPLIVGLMSDARDGTHSLN